MSREGDLKAVRLLPSHDANVNVKDGGTLEIDAEKGIGTTATVRFPMERKIPASR